MSEQPKIGSIGWMDLTVDDADRVRDFYAKVVGWKPEPVDMGGYSDFNMAQPESGDPAAGVCFKRGTNAGLPSVWMMYVVVADLDASMTQCTELGGEILRERKNAGGQGGTCVIKDPAGAVCALYQPG